MCTICIYKSIKKPFSPTSEKGFFIGVNFGIKIVGAIVFLHKLSKSFRTKCQYTCFKASDFYYK